MNDDFSDDILTTGLLAVEGVPTAARFDFEDDVDWFRVELDQWTAYQFDVTPKPAAEQIDYELRFYDDLGVEIEHYRSDNSAERIFAFNPGTWFVGVSYEQPFVDVTDYEVSVGLSTADPLDAGGEILSYTGFWSGTVAPNDSEIVTIDLTGDPAFASYLVAYTFDVIGADTRDDRTLADPHLEIRNMDGSIVKSDEDSGNGRDASLTIDRLRYAEKFEIIVSGSNGSTGNYLLRVRATDDIATGQKTDASIPFVILSEGSSTGVSGHLELGNDIDWIRVSMKKGQVGNFRLAGNFNDSFPKPIWGITDGTSGGWLTNTFQGGYDNNHLFVAQETRDYFIVVKNAGQKDHYNGQYGIQSRGMEMIKYWWNNDWFQQKFRQQIFAGSRNGFTQDIYTDLFDFQDGVQVYSREPFSIDGVEYAAGEVFQFDTWQVSLDFLPGNREVFIRRTSAGQPISDWASQNTFVIAKDPTPGFEGEIDGYEFDKLEFTFAFAETAPDYIAGEFWGDGFRSFDDGQRDAMRRAIAEWDGPLFADFTEADLGSTAPGEVDALIYFTDLGSEWIINPNTNPENAYDIVLNANQAAYDDPAEGNRAFYEMLRAVGKSMGAIDNPTLNRETSLFGLRYSQDIYHELFPSTPTYYDLNRATYYLNKNEAVGLGLYGINSHHNSGDTTYLLSGDPFVKTITDFSGALDHIDASGQSLRANIDLRPGGASFTGTWTDRPHTYYNDLRASLLFGTGGPQADYLSGNALENTLRGGDGNDFIIGRQGDDYLFGDSGNDLYEYRQSDGNDLIFDSSGRDVLSLWGVDNLDQLDEDLMFRRDGNDLIISLDYDGLFDERSDEITIVNFANPQNQIEILRLSNMDGQWAQVSLNSVFSQVGDVATRFALSSSRDEFGSLVTSV